ncbi:hypothetical protein [Microvirga arabica]|uniref:hypothetical protein n=1 Tax=Microvirga arabica TaxID=1128671 RepID=UPI0019395470|nr:hypothetical protein [Microvirga arabica]MBM1169641.1 hypothetical protein [Microvirga arabica]
MTHMDDQVAKHIKAMIRRITRKAPDNPEKPWQPETLHRAVRTLKGGPDYAYDLLPFTHSSWRDEGPKS